MASFGSPTLTLARCQVSLFLIYLQIQVMKLLIYTV